MGIKIRTFREAFQEAQNRLNAVDAELLVLHALRQISGKSASRLELYSKMNDSFPEANWENLIGWIQSRESGIPLQYVIGYQTFLDHEYLVTPEVLIPRPETEVLVVEACKKLERPLLGLEIGLGSGIISIEFLSRYPDLTMIASEVSEGAIHVASRNAQQILKNPSRLKIVKPLHPGEVWEPFDRVPVDFIISNPPYLASVAETALDVDKTEPHLALYAPAGDPLFFYRNLEKEAAVRIQPNGYLFLEIPHERSQKIAELFQPKHWDVQILPDLNGRERVLIAQLIES